MRNALILLVIIACSVIPSRSQGNECESTALVVTVVDALEMPVRGAQVRLEARHSADSPGMDAVVTATSADGVARFLKVPCGRYVLEVKFPPFPARQIEIEIV